MKSKIKTLWILTGLFVLLAVPALLAQYTSSGPGVLPLPGGPVALHTVVTNDYTAIPSDVFLEIRATIHAITLPSSGAGFTDGRVVIIKSMVPGATNSIVSTALLDGVSSYSITNQYGCVVLHCDGSTWSFSSKVATP